MAEPINGKAKVFLTSEQRAELSDIVRKGSSPARMIQHARILLLTDCNHPEGQRPDLYIAQAVGASENTVVRVRRTFVKQGQLAALKRKPRSTPATPPKIDGRIEAELVTLCCSTPPEGQKRWSLRMLAHELGRKGVVVSISHETVRKCLKKTSCGPGRANASVSRRRIGRVSSRPWKTSSMSIAKSIRKNSR